MQMCVYVLRIFAHYLSYANMCVCITYIHTHVLSYAKVYVYITCIHTFMQICVYTLHIHTHVLSYANMCVYITYTHTLLNLRKYESIHYTYTRTSLICKYVCKYYTYTHTSFHTQTCVYILHICTHIFSVCCPFQLPRQKKLHLFCIRETDDHVHEHMDVFFVNMYIVYKHT